jgi:outer membrane receptor protein involved in Fe transport
MSKAIATISLILLVPALLCAQTVEIKGRVVDASTKEALVGATVSIQGTTMGASTDAQGNYTIPNVSPGSYTFRFGFVGYVSTQRVATVRGEQGLVIDVALVPTTVEAGEVVVERNRARERETPVAFSDVGKMQIEEKIHGQDAPLLTKGLPGVYSYSPDGIGNGESKMFVRGFSQNYVQVLINGVPTNDPESNAVYWSNWGSVSSSAATIQVQRGAGSSLYGAGSFGGSFNIVTADAPPKPAYALNLSTGDPKNTMYGVDLNTGLVNNKFAAAFRIDRKVGEGSRTSGRYEGINYYMSLAWFLTPVQTLKFVLHGAPQEHGYSYSNPIAYFKQYSYNANPAHFLPHYLVEQLPVNATNKAPNYGLLDGSRELVDDEFVNLSHNFYHKPQAELHYRYDLTETSALTITGFYSMGRGGGSSMAGSNTSSSRLYSVGSDGTITTKFGPGGYLDDLNTIQNYYLSGAQQRISYSLHQQGGILASIDMKPLENLKLTLGGEYRKWTADHPGHYTNMFGGTSTTTSYQYRDTNNAVIIGTKINSFSRRVYMGDMDAPTSDVGNVFGWHLAGGADPTFQTQYRNYKGETPQYTAFAQGSYQLGKFNFLASLQLVGYSYKLTEYMPSENGLGQELKAAQVAGFGPSIKEGPVGDGTFLMKGTNNRWYQFTLVNESRSRTFLQPKGGINYNFNDNLNAFANYAHVERFVDLSVYYNQGRVNPNVGDEKSDQFELGIGWTSEIAKAKANYYNMTWANKSAQIFDPNNAGTAGYDRNGYKSELIGTSKHEGLELEVTLPFDWLGVKGLELTSSLTMMNNRWTEVLPEVLTNPTTGARNAFNTGALNSQGKVDTLFFDELAGTKVASGPQSIVYFSLNYRHEGFFCGLNANIAANNYMLDGGTYMAVDGDFYFDQATGKQKFRSVYDNKLPAYAVIDAYIGGQFDLGPLNTTISMQVLNLLDTEYLAWADRNGVVPGPTRAVRLNLNVGI